MNVHTCTTLADCSVRQRAALAQAALAQAAGQSTEGLSGRAQPHVVAEAVRVQVALEGGPRPHFGLERRQEGHVVLRAGQRSVMPDEAKQAQPCLAASLVLP